MHLRNEQPGEKERISHIHYAAFKGHFTHAPGAEPTEHLIVEHLRTSGALTVSLVAEADGEAVGHIAMSPATVGASTEGWFLLGPVGVMPEHQCAGIGSALIREGLTRLRNDGAAGVVLVGDPKYYKRFGFGSIPGLHYEGVPDSYVLGLSFVGQSPQGGVIAHEAFRVAHS